MRRPTIATLASARTTTTATLVNALSTAGETASRLPRWGQCHTRDALRDPRDDDPSVRAVAPLAAANAGSRERSDAIHDDWLNPRENRQVIRDAQSSGLKQPIPASGEHFAQPWASRAQAPAGASCGSSFTHVNVTLSRLQTS